MAEPESTHDPVSSSGAGSSRGADDEVVESLSDFAKRGVGRSSAQVMPSGALSRVDLNCLDGMRKKYERIPVNERVGVAALLADVVLSPEDERALHLHFVASRRNGTALAGQRKQVRHE